jgi:hypothetical protein
VADACGAAADSCGPNVARLTPAARTAALAGPLLLHVAAVLTVIPIAALAFEMTRDRLAAARVAALWPLVPGAALFVPALDPALALPITLALASFRAAIAADSRARRTVAALSAGLAAAAAGFLSYGSALFLLLGAGVVLASLPVAVWSERRARIGIAMALGTVTAVAVFAAAIALGHDPLGAARTALAIHAENYTAHRSYALWLVFGPIDLVVFLGLPIALGLAAQSVSAWRQKAWRAPAPPPRWTLAVLAALLVLFVGGSIRGEVGRLLIPVMPLLLIGGLLRLDDRPRPEAHTAALTAGLLVAFDVVIRLNWRL